MSEELIEVMSQENLDDSKESFNKLKESTGSHHHTVEETEQLSSRLKVPTSHANQVNYIPKSVNKSTKNNNKPVKIR